MKFTIKNSFTGQVQVLLEGKTFEEALEIGVKNKADLSGADLSGANLSGADLSRANLSGVDLSRADLSGADLSRANLSGAYLPGANLYGAYLYGADLSGADLSGANLSGADLSRANLSRADLSGANLSGVDLPGANLSRANLSRANLSGADLYEAKALPEHIPVSQNSKWIIMVSKTHISIGCETKTAKEWKEFFKSKKSITTDPSSPEYELIRLSFEYADKIRKHYKRRLTNWEETDDLYRS